MTRITMLVVLALFALGSAGAGGATAAEIAARKTQAADAPQIDGKVDKVWDTVRATRVPIAEGTIGKIEVTMKVLYTDAEIFFLLQWPDKTMSLNRFWEFDGKDWKNARGDEDRLSIMWDTGNMSGFQRRGCTDACHQKDRKVFLRTNGPAERADLWAWKAQRTNPVNQAEDQHLVDTLRQDGDVQTGRRVDATGAGGYEANWDDKANRPRFTFKEGAKPGPVLLKEEAVEIKDPATFKRGDRLPRDVVAPFTRGSGDLQATAVWERGRWTLEMKRARATDDKEHDVQFTDPARAYAFGIAVHDDVEGDEHSHTGTTVYRLLLK